MEKILIDWEHMDKYTNVPLEYRFIDKVEVLPGKEAWGMKLVSTQDWYFKMHFPHNPIMPGVFLMEAMQQTGSFIVTTLPETKEKLMLFHGCEAMRMYKSVRPGDILKTHVQLKSYLDGIAKYYGEAMILEQEKEARVCSMEFMLILTEEMENVFPMTK